MSPGITPISGANPGFATFTVDDNTLAAENWQLHFLALDRTYGWDTLPADLSLYPFRDVSMSQFGLFSLSPVALKDFKNTLQKDQSLLYRYLVAKIGYEPTDSMEYENAIEKIYISKLSLVTKSARKTYKYICQMHKNKNTVEMDECIASYKMKNEVGFLQI